MDEFSLIRDFVSQLRFNKSVIVGPGDDCAVVKLPRNFLQLLTTDMLIEGVHFRRDWMTPEQIGAKALWVNISDIAAMGGIPRYALISVGLPQKTSLRETQELLKGFRKVAERTGVLIIGGDTNASPHWVINVTLVGEPFRGRLLTRKGARVGDAIYVTGTLGDSALGLAALNKHKARQHSFFVKKHIQPPNRIAMGQRLAPLSHVHSMIDLSDGLIGDLGHILEESQVGAEIFVDRLPTSKNFLAATKKLRQDPLALQLSGGEDYELLFTASPKAKIPGQIEGIPLTLVGKVLPKNKGLRLKDTKGRRIQKAFPGFSHFA